MIFKLLFLPAVTKIHFSLLYQYNTKYASDKNIEKNIN